MDIRKISAQQPQNIDEALWSMRTALDFFHERNDKRAIFLRLYYIMTLEVHAAVHQLGDYRGKQIFLDPGWIERLSGMFSSLYFRSLDTFEHSPSREVERAWKIAYQVADDDSSTVVQNAMLGINAHINYDLPYAIALNLTEHGDLASQSALLARRFDHDQVNNLLVRAMSHIQDVLARDYGEGIAFLDGMLGQLDEKVSEFGLKYYRERVWWDALAFAAAIHNESETVVREKLNWESYKLAQILKGRTVWEKVIWFPERLFGFAGRLRGTKREFAGIVVEEEGGVVTRVRATVNPFR